VHHQSKSDGHYPASREALQLPLLFVREPRVYAQQPQLRQFSAVPRVYEPRLRQFSAVSAVPAMPAVPAVRAVPAVPAVPAVQAVGCWFNV